MLCLSVYPNGLAIIPIPVGPFGIQLAWAQDWSPPDGWVLLTIALTLGAIVYLIHRLWGWAGVRRGPRPGRTYITEAFLADIRETGPLAKAAQRASDAHHQFEPLPKTSTWALVCEEVVDTEYDPEHYDRVVAELLRRGLSPAELEEMRVFAWKTAGWLNYEKMLWDWVSLDERDIRLAIAWLAREGEIDRAQRKAYRSFLNKYRFGPHAAQG